MTRSIDVSAQMTPNPNTLKFMVNVDIIEKGSIDFSNNEMAEDSILAKNLFALDGIAGVFLAKNFISVTKVSEAEWMNIAEPVTEAIRDTLANNEKVVDEALIEEIKQSGGSEIEQKIIDILDNEIRPAVAMDGGDIIFDHFQEGIVYLQLQGACQTCPSSVMTLKMGIENRLKEEIPEVKEVMQV